MCFAFQVVDLDKIVFILRNPYSNKHIIMLIIDYFIFYIYLIIDIIVIISIISIPIIY